MTRALPELDTGAVVDGLYEVEARIGAGGMASVYRARQRETGDRVAIKLIDLGSDDVAGARRRFFNELLLATRVRHPNIVEVHDFGLLAQLGTPYIVMELLRGENLRQRLKRARPMDPDEAVPLFLGALGALRVAHELNVVHKDLKPSNLFLCDGAEPSLVVVDFGIASRVSEGGEKAVEYHGTPRYSAPEYLLDQVVSPALDVYQVGLAFCEALTGRPVVTQRGAPACFKAHARHDLQIPSDVLGPRLEPVIQRALAFDPADRYTDAGQLLEALREAHGPGVGPSLRQTGPPTPIRRRTRGGEVSGYSAPVGASDTDLDATRLMEPQSTASFASAIRRTPVAVAPAEPEPSSRRWMPMALGLGGFAAGAVVMWAVLGG